MAEYKVTLDNFEGPLDLLIHLVKEKKMEISEIDISDITSQYVDYIQHFEGQLDVASEYLVMAAYLIELKSKLLLPKDEEEIESEFEEDTRQKLVERLLEYKRYKEISEVLRESNEERSKYFIKSMMTDLSGYKVVEEEDPTKIPDNLDVYKLVKSMQKMFKRLSLQKPMETHISNKEISTEEVMESIEKKLKENESIMFEDLFKSDFSKQLFVVSFLAILVLSRHGKILIEQDEIFGSIKLMLRTDEMEVDVNEQ